MNEQLDRNHPNRGMRLLFAALVALIIHGSFFPWHFHVRQLGANPLWILVHSWPPGITRSIVRDIGVNLGVYFPLGVVGWIAFANVRSLWARIAIPVLTATGLSVSVESLQLFQETRTCSMVDVVCNCLGAVAGVALAAAMKARIDHPWMRAILCRGDALLVAASWLVWQLFPMFPIWKWELLHAKLHSILSWDGGIAAFLTALTGWLIAACIFHELGIPHTVRWMSRCAAVLVPIRGLLLHGRFVGLPEILGTLLALSIWRFALCGMPLRVRITAYVAIVYLCTRQLLPFVWEPGVQEFVWVPFNISLQGDSLMDFSILIEKSFLYSASVWVLWSSGTALARSAVVITSLLTLTEAVQTGIPGRVPEITDPFLALLASVVFWIARTNISNFADVEFPATGLRHTPSVGNNQASTQSSLPARASIANRPF